MAMFRMDGFDLYGDQAGFDARWVTTGTPTFSTTSGRFGAGGVTINSSDESFAISNDFGTDFITIGSAIKVSSVSGEDKILGLYGTSTPSSALSNDHATVSVAEDGSLILKGDGGSTIATSSPGVIAEDTWYYLEAQLRAVDGATANVYVNGTLVVSGTGDFSDTASSVFAAFGNTDTTVQIVYDDVYVANDASAYDDPFGDVKIATLLPNADTAQADWAVTGAASGFDAIDDALGTNGDGDTTYISDTTLNNKSEFDMEDLAESPDSIAAIQINTRASKTDTGTIEYTHYVDSSGTESSGTAVAPANGTYALVSDVFETDPNTAAAWTEAGVNAVKLGVEITG